MRFNILSLGLVATVFMSASVRAIPVGENLDDVAGGVGNGGVGDTAKGVTDAVANGNLGNSLTDGHITGDLVDCALGNGLEGAIGCVTASSDPAATALKKRSLNLSPRRLFQRRAEAVTTDDIANPDINANNASDTNAAAGGEDEEELDEEEPEEEEEEEDELTSRGPDGDAAESNENLVRRKANEDEEDEDEDEDDENDKGKRKRSITGEPDEEEPEEEEPEENEIEPEENEIEPEENEVEPDEEEADELGDAEPAGRR
ncbi:uncharacterized protein ATC70_006985 [Mucor velutinosus]|uniref:Uncharacterized protein n=1 Tax=Mucor velutinosus TaxID=708070 RepID=A0AAN7D440_9FUNG|nr:hypothetical protein ATC70_006985 [Mucor velutinosus]